MIGYVTVGTNDLERARVFYDALMGELGAQRFMSDDRLTIYGKDPGAPMVAVCIPWNKETATAGNGAMVALNAGSKELAEKIYRKALELGGTDEGEPGPRGDLLWGGYFRDLDGNKFFAFTMGS